MQNKFDFTEDILSSRKNDDDKVDLSQIFKFFKRHKFFISIFTGSTVFLSGLYSFIPMPVWLGEFQIVITPNKKKDSNLINPFSSSSKLSKIVSGANMNNQLNTEVEILKSPSVLMPIFKYVKNKKKGTKYNIDNWDFKRWKKENVKIALEEGTTILNISYFDNNKELILPILNKISEAYQLYSDRDRQKDIQDGINYLEKQIEIYKLKSQKSLRVLLKYSFDNEVNLSDKIKPEEVRFQKAYQERLLRKIKTQLEKKDKNLGEFIYYGSLFPELNKFALEIYNLDMKIANLEYNFKKTDKLLIALRSEKDIKANLFINKINEFVNSKINLLEAQKSVFISKEKLLKVRELENIAQRDSITLKNLENQFVTFSLDQAKASRPWELITNPTLLDSPVSPRKIRILAIGFVMGIFISILFSLVKDERSDLIFSSKGFMDILKIPPEFLIEINSTQELVEIIKLIWERLSPKKNNRIILIKVGFIDENIVKKVKQSFKAVAQDNEVLIFDDLSQSNKSDFQFFICDNTKVLKSELLEMNKKIVLQGNSLKGCFLLDNVDQ